MMLKIPAAKNPIAVQVMMVKGENYRQLDLSRLPAGMYMVKLTELKTESGTRQLMIRH